MFNNCIYIGLSGAQCVGKSSIIRKLADEFGCVMTVESVSREVAARSRLSTDDVEFNYEVSRKYVEIFKQLEDVKDEIILFDRTPYDGVAYVWARKFGLDEVIGFKRTADEIMSDRFDVIIILETDGMEYTDDGVRSLYLRDEIQWRLEALYASQRVPVLRIGGTWDERYEAVKKILLFWRDRLCK